MNYMSTATIPHESRLGVFRHRDFSLLMAATVFQNLVMPMQFITLTFWSIDNYPGEKVLFSGLIVAVRGIGMLIFSLLGGAIADRFERRKVLLICESIAFTTTALMAVCMIWKPFDDATIAALLVLVFLAASNMAVDGPSRSASIPVVVNPSQIGHAIALNNVAQQLTFPAVLPLVGWLSGTIGPGKVVAGSLIAWAFIIPLIAMLRYSSKAMAMRRSSSGFVRDIRDGLGYARRDATIFAVIAMIVAMQVVAMPGVGMLGPVWMTEVLGLSRGQFGLLAMLWGIGAVTSSLTFAARPQMGRRGTTLAAMVLLFAASGILFAHSRSVPLTAVANFGLGFAMTGAIVTAMTLVQYTVSEQMRGRVMGLFPLVMGFSMLSVAPVSFAGQGLGLEVVVPATEWAALAIAGLVVLGAPALRRSRPARAEATSIKPA